ncbi:MAG TPA: GNAT family N-acetyltransferase [Vicinamibacterales bacterium]|nr:GNAT family N-acetyltransferase [Vicinamibacterales bacterium]
MEIDTPPRDEVLVRTLRPSDRETIVSIDAVSVGRRRDQFLALKLAQAFADTGIAISLAAEIDGHVVGFVLARVYYGEFGVMEPAAVIDVIGVHPDFRGRHVAAALVDQLRMNLIGLGIARLQTEVQWDNPDLLGFFQREGFAIAQRICLDLNLKDRRTDVS